jgi:hypothetical protein
MLHLIKINIVNNITKHYNLNSNTLDYVYNQYKIYDLVKKNPLKYFPLINIQNTELCIVAVTANKKTLKYVENQNLDICLAAATTDDLETLNIINREYIEECIKKINKSKHMKTKNERITNYTFLYNMIMIHITILSVAEKTKPQFSNYVKQIKKNRYLIYFFHLI